MSVNGTDEGLCFGDDILDDFFGELCKDGGAVVKGFLLVWEICVSSICNCCSRENFDAEMKFGVDGMSLIFIVLDQFWHTFSSSSFNNNFIDAFSSSRILICSVKLSISRLSLLYLLYSSFISISNVSVGVAFNVDELLIIELIFFCS